MTTIKQIFLFLTLDENIFYFEYKDFKFTIYYNDYHIRNSNDRRLLRHRVRHFIKSVNNFNINFQLSFSN